MFGRKNEDKKEAEELQQNECNNALEDVNQELQIQQKEKINSLQEQLARLTADFQNYKKRTEKDQLLWTDRARSDVFSALLPSIDNFDRALLDAQKNEQSDSFKEWITGFALISKSLYEMLAAQKVTPIEQITVFDPHLHEAVVQVESADHESGAIVEVLQKGFMFKDTVLRTAKVTVAK